MNLSGKDFSPAGKESSLFGKELSLARHIATHTISAILIAATAGCATIEACGASRSSWLIDSQIESLEIKCTGGKLSSIRVEGAEISGSRALEAAARGAAAGARGGM